MRHLRPLKVATQLQQFVDPFTAEVEDTDANRVFEITADLREDAEVARVVEVALARFGQIDVLVNTIGAFDRRTNLLGAALSPRPDVFTLNALVPTAVAVRVALDFWRHHDLDNAARYRVVVNLSAAASVDAADRTWGATFGATKAAQNMLSLRMAEAVDRSTCGWSRSPRLLFQRS